MKCKYCGGEMIVVKVFIDKLDFDLDLDAVTYKCEPCNKTVQVIYQTVYNKCAIKKHKPFIESS